MQSARGRSIAAIAKATLVTLVAVVAHPASSQAQGFLESLFGKGPTSAAPPMSYPSPLRARAYSPLPVTRDHGDDPRERTEKGGPTFRTMCVRLCDGYYWPISYATTRGRFWKDADTCRASCGSEAVLYYHPSKGDPTDMVDLQGRGYSLLPTSLRYRKVIVEGCKCRPEPWAMSEVDRHRRYALTKSPEEQLRELHVAAAAAALPDTALPSGADTRAPIPFVIPPLDETPPPKDDDTDGDKDRDKHSDDPSATTRPTTTPPSPLQPRPSRRPPRSRDYAGTPPPSPAAGAARPRPHTAAFAPAGFGGPKRWPGD